MGVYGYRLVHKGFRLIGWTNPELPDLAEAASLTKAFQTLRIRLITYLKFVEM